MKRLVSPAVAVALGVSVLSIGVAGAGGSTHMPESSTASSPVDASASAVLAHEFPQLLTAMQDTAAPRLQATEPSGLAGRVSRGQVVWSSEPLELGGDPVDRALMTDGDVATPRNPLVEATLPFDGSAAFGVGSGAGAYRVEAIGASDGRHEVVGDGVVHEDTHADTDSIVRAVSGGVETFELLHSADAPEVFRYRLLDGVQARSAGRNRVEVIRDGRAIGVVSAPVVVDAAGRNVSATLGTDGAVVKFTVAHRGSGYTYPVLADPSWTADYNFSSPGQGVGGLFFDPEDPSGYDVAAETGGAYPGITIRPLGGRAYTSADTAKAFFAAPPGSTIDRAEFRDVFRLNDLDRQTIRLGLYGNGVDIKTDYSTNVPDTRPLISLDDPANAAKFAMIWMFTPPCEVGEADCPRSVAANNTTRVTVRQLVVTLIDPGAPAMGLTGTLKDVGDSWIKAEGTETVGLQVSDDGSGVKSWTLRQERGNDEVDLHAPATNACDTSHATPGQQALPCPETDGFADTDVDLGQLLEGRIRIVPSATDFAGNLNDGAANALSLRLDRSPPSVTAIGGALLDGPTARWQQIRGSKPLDIDLADTYSGVKQTEVEITPVNPAGPVDSESIDTCTPPGSTDQPCPTAASTSVPIDGDALPDGELLVAATATDFVGYESTPVSRRLFKDNGLPAATARGELTELEGEWTNDTTNVAVTLQGKDRRSGIARLELYASDDSGRRLVDDVVVCEPEAIDAAAGETCPLQTSRAASLDLGDLETGEVTLEAFATDAAGNRDPSPDSWDTYVDHDAPSEVNGVSAINKDAATLRMSWVPASDEGSGVAGYEYRIITSERTTEWTSTPFPGAEIPTQLQTQVFEVRAKDKAGNTGSATQFGVNTKKDAGKSSIAKCKLLVRLGQASDKHGTYTVKATGVTEPNIALEGNTTLRCPVSIDLVPPAVGIGAIQRLRLAKTTDTFPAKVIPDPVTSENTTGRARVFSYETVRFRCLPGRRGYELEANGGAAGVWKAAKNGPVRAAWSGAIVKRSYQCNESGLWRHDAYWDSRPKRASDALRADMLSPVPEADHSKYDSLHAHHIVPAYQSSQGAWRVQARAYACGLSANLRTNGVFVSKAYHNDVHRNGTGNARYYYWMFRKFNKAMGRNGTCNPGEALKVVGSISGALRRERPGFLDPPSWFNDRPPVSLRPVYEK